MFASVAYSDGKKAIVPTETIQNFNPQNYEKKQKYKILWADDGRYYDGVILFVKETKEEVQKEMEERRVAVPNFVYCKSATNLKEIFKENKKPQHPKAAAKAAVTDVDDIVKKKLTAVAARKNIQAVKKKAEDVLDGAPPSKKAKGLKPEEKEPKTVENRPKSAVNRAKTVENGPETAEKGAKSAENGPKTVEKRPKTVEKEAKCAENGPKTIENEPKSAEKGAKTAEKGPKTAEKEPKTAEKGLKTAEKGLKTAEKGPKTAEKGPKITKVSAIKSKITIVDNRREGEKSADNTEDSGSKMASLIRENKEPKGLNSVLKKENQQQKKLIQEQKAEVEDLRGLNSDALRTCVDLNKDVIARFDQLCEIVRDLRQQGEETFSRDGGFPPVGYENKWNEQTHIGNGLYLPTCQFASLMTNSRPKLFVKEMARAVFGKKTLLESTVTGKESNRSKKKRADQNKPPPKQLDPKRMSCIRACLEFFLKDERFQKKGIVLKETHLYNVGNYVSEYISDLKKKARNENELQPSPAQRTDEVKDQEDEENCENEGGQEREENDKPDKLYETHMDEDDDDTEEMKQNIESEENNDDVDEHEEDRQLLIDELEGIDDKSESD